AGGISVPGVANTLWVLIALLVPTQASATVPTENRSGFPAAIGLGMFALAALCYFTAYRPLTEVMAARQRANDEPRRAAQHLLAATAADPWSENVWRELAAWRYARWQAEPTPEHWQAV